MEVLLIGANRGLGYEILKELIQNKIYVNCLIRKKGQINFESPYLKIFFGDATNSNDIKKAIGKSDVIISTINVQRKNIFPWSRLINSKNTISSFIINILNLSNNKANRIITISAWGGGESIENVPRFFKYLIKFSNLKYPYDDHEIHEEIIENSDLNWTINRPTALTNEKKYHKVKEYGLKEKVKKLTISRKSLANFLVKNINNKSHFKKKITVSKK